MISPEQLRLSAALAHSVPDAVLTVTGHDDEVHVISYQPGAALDPCQWRQRLLDAGPCALARCVRSVELGGRLAHLTAGVYTRHAPTSGDECWFATFLFPDDVQSALAGCEEPERADLLTVGIRVDADLGVSCVRLTIDASGPFRCVPEIALRAYSACAVAELDALLARRGPATP